MNVLIVIFDTWKGNLWDYACFMKFIYVLLEHFESEVFMMK